MALFLPNSMIVRFAYLNLKLRLKHTLVSSCYAMNQIPYHELKSSLIRNENSWENSPVEWWFFQGYYQVETGKKSFFMATLFRYRYETPDPAQTNGFQLMLTVLNECDKLHHSETWVDEAAICLALENLSNCETHLDEDVRLSLIDELQAKQPPHPIRLVDGPRRFIGFPVETQWNGFELKQDKEGFDLVFFEPGTCRRISTRLALSSPLLDVARGAKGLPLSETMTYFSHPRLVLTGHTDSGQPITGEAWYDHQWGNPGLVGVGLNSCNADPIEPQIANEEPVVDRFLAWDWFGINLDDGSDLLVMVAREVDSQKVVSQHATLRDSSGETKSTQDFSMVPQRCWESPSTRIRYSIQWDIRIPSFDATLLFRPYTDDQEVLCLGATRAIWQGVGAIDGVVAGRSVKGRARGEFQGYGYLFDLQDYLQRISEDVDRSLEKNLPRNMDESAVERMVGPATWKHEPAAYDEMISRPVWDLIDRSGKRWRPVFGLLMLEALGVVSKPYQDLICNMSEMIHTGALIIDDIEDQSELRRGQSCLHLKYGLDVAVNAGNLLYFIPALLLLEHPDLTAEKKLQLHAIRERTMISAHGGQTVDIFWSRKMCTTRLSEWLSDDLEDRILQMYAMKTGAGVMGLAESAAVIAGADPKVTAACVEFARNFAVSFQIVDDVHNFSRSPQWTKICGEDLANGKLTYVIAAAFKMLPPEQSERLQKLLCCQHLRNDPSQVLEGIELIHQSGALQACRNKARALSQQGWLCFSQQIRSSEAKIMLHAMSRKLLDLSFDT